MDVADKIHELYRKSRLEMNAKDTNSFIASIISNCLYDNKHNSEQFKIDLLKEIEDSIKVIEKTYKNGS
jgi:hypothetical protein